MPDLSALRLGGTTNNGWGTENNAWISVSPPAGTNVLTIEWGSVSIDGGRFTPLSMVASQFNGPVPVDVNGNDLVLICTFAPGRTQLVQYFTPGIDSSLSFPSVDSPAMTLQWKVAPAGTPDFSLVFSNGAAIAPALRTKTVSTTTSDVNVTNSSLTVATASGTSLNVSGNIDANITNTNVQTEIINVNTSPAQVADNMVELYSGEYSFGLVNATLSGSTATLTDIPEVFLGGSLTVTGVNDGSGAVIGGLVVELTFTPNVVGSSEIIYQTVFATPSSGYGFLSQTTQLPNWIYSKIGSPLLTGTIQMQAIAVGYDFIGRILMNWYTIENSTILSNLA